MSTSRVWARWESILWITTSGLRKITGNRPRSAPGVVGWQVLLDGLEITQFTYFQQCGGVDLDPVSVELTYGLDRIAAYLQGVDNVYDVRWTKDLSYGSVRLAEEQQFSAYNFEHADPHTTRKLFELHEREAAHLLDGYAKAKPRRRSKRYPVMAAYDHVPEVLPPL